MDRLPSHPIFALRQGQLNDDRYFFQTGYRRHARLALTSLSDLIVAVRKELRILSLADVKSAGEEAEKVPYKTLTSPNLTFSIHSILLNPTGKLLAAVGVRQIAVLALPRKGTATPHSEIQCRSVVVGTTFQSPVAQVRWHPYGENGATLLVLTQDGILREYDVEIDAATPQSTVSFIHRDVKTFSSPDFSALVSTSTHSFSLQQRVAVSFCFGPDTRAWGPLTVYVLLKNGDIYALAPFLPRRAALPLPYIQTLSALVAERVAQANDAVAAGRDPDSAEQQLAAFSAQYRYLNLLVKACKEPPHSTPGNPLGASSPIGKRKDAVFHVQLSLLGRLSNPEIQGPFAFSPAPLELDHDLDVYASDICGLRCGDAAVFALAFSDGRVDLCLDVEPIEARWTTLTGPTKEEKLLPFLSVFDTVDLGLVRATPNEDALETNFATLVADPVYSSVLYVYHALGVHCIYLPQWLDDVGHAQASSSAAPPRYSASSDSSAPPNNLTAPPDISERARTQWVLKLAHEDDASLRKDLAELPTALAGLVVVSDPYVGYQLIATSSSLQTLCIELEMRLPREDLALDALAEQVEKIRVKKEEDNETDAFEAPLVFNRKSVFSRPYADHIEVSENGLLLNPDLIRGLVSSANDLVGELREMTVGCSSVQNAVEGELAIQALQLDKISTVQKEIDRLKTETSNKWAALMENQTALTLRADSLLRRLMASYNDPVSEREREWAVHLNELKAQVLVSEDAIHSLEARATVASKKWEELKPTAIEMLASGSGLGADALNADAKSAIARLDTQASYIQQKQDELEQTVRDTQLEMRFNTLSV